MNDKNRGDDMVHNSSFTTHNSLVPRLRFPEFWEAGEWEVRRLGEISEVKTGPFGSTLHQSDYVKVGTPIITVEHLGETGIEGGNAPMVSDSDKDRLTSYALNEGDIVFSRVGSVDRSAIVRAPEKGWLFSGRLLRLRIATADDSASFLNQLLKHAPSKSQIRNCAVGQTMASLNTEILKGISLPFPSNGEQQKIADCLSSLDALIAAQAEKLDALKTHKKGLMQQLFPREGETVPRLRFPEFREAGEWEEVALGEVAEIKLGKMLDSKKHITGNLLPYLNNVAVRWNDVDTSNLPKMYFDDDELDRFGLSAGDVVVCEGGEPGRSAVWDGHLPDLKFQKAIHRVRFNVPFEPQLLVLYLESIAGTSRFEKLFTGGGIKHLTRETFAQLKVPLISPAEQQKIAACLSSLDTLIAAQAEKLDALKTHKKGLLQQLFPSPEATTA